MKFLSSLDPRDRKLLLWFVGAGIALAVLSGFAIPNENSNDNPLPSTYLSGQHGARAAYETLLRSGYPIERWERPLAELAATAGPDTVVIFEQYHDAKALAAHRASEHFKNNAVGGLYQKLRERSVENLLAVA